MQRLTKSGLLLAKQCARIAATLALAGGGMAAAQDVDPPSNAEAHPGEFVYSRDVPYGAATRRFAQGEARTVVLDPTPLVNRTLLIGMEPLSDAEQAAIAAPLIQSFDSGTRAIEAGLAPLVQGAGAGDFTRSESGASAAGGIVNQSLGVIPSALGVIARNVGNGG